MKETQILIIVKVLQSQGEYCSKALKNTAEIPRPTCKICWPACLLAYWSHGRRADSRLPCIWISLLYGYEITRVDDIQLCKCTWQEEAKIQCSETWGYYRPWYFNWTYEILAHLYLHLLLWEIYIYRKALSEHSAEVVGPLVKTIIIINGW